VPAVDGRDLFSHSLRALCRERSPTWKLRFPGHQPEKLRIRAEAVTAGPLDRLEIIYNGRVIKSVVSPGSSERLVADFEGNFNDTGWLASRCSEHPSKTIRFAHTSPVYLQFGEGDSTFSEDVRFFLDWMDPELAYYEKQPGFKAP